MKKMWIVITLLSLVGASVGYYLYTKPLADLADVDAELTMEAPALAQAYAADESAANLQYLDKIVEVRGTISNFESENGVTKVTLQTVDPLMGVLCEFGEEIPSESLTVGSQILVRGQCTGVLMDVVLVRCVLLPS